MKQLAKANKITAEFEAVHEARKFAKQLNKYNFKTSIVGSILDNGEWIGPYTVLATPIPKFPSDATF